MNLLNTKLMLGIASIALGISLMVSTYVFAENTEPKEIATVTEAPAEPDVVLLAPESPFLNKCMVTNVEQFASIYDTPVETGILLGKMYTGSVADVLERGESWTKISSGSVIGYVSNNYLVFDEAAETLANQVCKWVATVNTNALNVRKEPDINSGVLGLVYKTENFDVLGSENGWITIQYEGESGYISEDYLSVVQQIGTAISVEEEAAAIAAEEARLAAIAAEEARVAAENQARIQAAISGSQFVETIQTSSYSVTEESAYLLACVVDCEAGWESYDGKLAVANIILNRLNGGTYGNTIESVVYARNQFSVVGTTLTNKMINGPRQESIDATKAALAGTNNVPEYTNFAPSKIAQYDIYTAYTIIGNHVFYRKY